MSCKRAYTDSGQIQHGSDEEKYVQLSAQQQSDLWKKILEDLRKSKVNQN